MMRTVWAAAVVAALVSMGRPLAAQPSARDSDLVTGIEFVEIGDFEAAEGVLLAVTSKLEGVPGKLLDLADAYLYLGIARLELDNISDARRAFREAQRRNRKLTLAPTAFSAQVIREFALAATESDDVGGSGATLPPPAPSLPAVEWLFQEPSVLRMNMALGTRTQRCDGSLELNKDRKMFAWTSTEGGDCASFQLPFERVRPAAKANEGGVAITFAAGSHARMTLIPATGADYFEGGIDGLQASDLPPELDGDIRQAVNRINDYLEGGTNLSVTRMQYGMPIDASLAELINAPGEYDGRAVRTRGRLEVISRDRNQYYLYAETFTVLVTPDGAEGASRLIQAQARDLRNTEVEITGAFRRRYFERGPEKGVPEFEIYFWRFDGGIETTIEAPAGRRMTLQELSVMEQPPAEPVTVIGKFRGGNLFADLPRNSRRRNDDWVVRDDIYSAWVTGKDPEGDGWRLDRRSVADSVNWIAVTGVPRVQDGFVYLQAQSVALSRPPSPTATVINIPIVPSRRKPGAPAEIQYSIPRAGLEELGADSSFFVQFSKEMDGASFNGRVLLQYVGALAGLKRFVNLRVAYDPIRRTITIDPGEPLEKGRDLECLLMPGIRDMEGVQMQPTADAKSRGALRILRWRIADN